MDSVYHDLTAANMQHDLEPVHLFPKKIWSTEIEQEGHDGSVLLHWLICEIPSYQTLQCMGIG